MCKNTEKKNSNNSKIFIFVYTDKKKSWDKATQHSTTSSEDSKSSQTTNTGSKTSIGTAYFFVCSIFSFGAILSMIYAGHSRIFFCVKRIPSFLFYIYSQISEAPDTSHTLRDLFPCCCCCLDV